MTSTPIAKPEAQLGALPVVGLLGAILSVQVGAAFAKGLFPVLGAEGTTMLRLVIGALMLAAVLRPWKVLPTRTGLPWLAAYGVTVSVMNLLFYNALERIPLGICVALEFTGPLFVATLGSRRLLDLVWVVLAVAGIVLLSPFADVSRGLDPVGVLLALAAGGCWGLYIIFAQKAGAGLGARTSAYGMAIAALVALPFGFAAAEPYLADPHVLATAVVVGLFSSALPFWLEMMVLARMPAKVYGMIVCLEPAGGALTGFLFLHESLSVLQCAGIGAVIAAAFGAAVTARAPVPSTG
ncbi:MULTISPECIES: DMT family transporter [unclassified Mesorhizobium]|uniref:EamA family transporter n=1 Tax=unclassified Mesorhizobium TaxID=325217 RepID=UPI000FCA1A5A|nr:MULTISPECIES: DMT family transporter [unclassified Mesorhizobium]TGP20371.1 DMT family transporter [Mesorhizobium sp. M1D.F.Ca.ET.231.01.1.1]TGP27848.1 DMT family transporter [Mesorhizobium sp. M1D.F.Ca.ET.234.01.1.1]TGS42198.1 DMT family transporter [Mesorhizobium sp. M1D.F.Ca.ET.184.01.1.1]TGS59548.1 DMT family transporter [Mesorhizobium sp. M1D.F.Ca.ET.183.01.1.1]